MPAPSPAPPPVKRPTKGAAHYPRSEIPDSCYTGDRTLARKVFADDALRRLKNECKDGSNFRWRDDGACADWVLCLSDGAWNVWYPEGVAGTWGRKEKEAFKEEAKRDVGRSEWEVGKVRKWADGRGVEVLWKRKDRDRRRETSRSEAEQAQPVASAVAEQTVPIASGSGSGSGPIEGTSLVGLGLGTMGEPVVGPVAQPVLPPAFAPRAASPIRPSASTRAIVHEPISEVARGKQPERVRTGRSRSPPRAVPTKTSSTSRRSDGNEHSAGPQSQPAVSSLPAQARVEPAVIAARAPAPIASLPAPTTATSRRAASPALAARAIPSLADPRQPIPILAPAKTAPRSSAGDVVTRAPAPFPVGATPSSRTPTSSRPDLAAPLPSKPTVHGSTSLPKKPDAVTRIAEGTSAAWAEARPSPKIVPKKTVSIPATASSPVTSIASRPGPVSAPQPVAPSVPAAAHLAPLAKEAGRDEPSSGMDELSRMKRELEEARIARKAAEDENERLRKEHAQRHETPTDVLVTGFPADAKEMELRRFISSTAIPILGLTMHGSHAVVQLPSAKDASETVRLLKDHEFRPGVILTLLVTGVQVARPAQRADPSMRSSQLPTPPPAAGSVDSEVMEVDEIDDSEDEAPVAPRRAAPRVAEAGPGPSTSAAVARAAAMRAQNKKVARPRTVPDSDEDDAAVSQRAPTAKRSKGETRSTSSGGGVFSLGSKKATLTAKADVSGDKSRRMLVEGDLLIHASMRGVVSIWSKDTFTRAAKSVQLDLPVGNSVEEASVAGDRLVLGLSCTSATAGKKTGQIGWVRLTDLDTHLAPEYKVLHKNDHVRGERSTDGVASVLGLPTSAFSDDDLSVFASGGIEHAVRLWHVDEDNRATSVSLHHKHKSRVESLLYCKRKNVLYSAGGYQTFAFDMAQRRLSDQISVPDADKIQVNYVHFGPTSDTLILETRNVTNQYKLYDLRRSRTQLFDFGTQIAAGKSTTKYKKGCATGQYFASGEDGLLKIWDLRKLPAPCQEIRLHPAGTEMRQVTFFSNSSSSPMLADLTKEHLSVRTYSQT